MQTYSIWAWGWWVDVKDTTRECPLSVLPYVLKTKSEP